MSIFAYAPLHQTSKGSFSLERDAYFDTYAVDIDVGHDHCVGCFLVTVAPAIRCRLTLWLHLTTMGERQLLTRFDDGLGK